MSEPARKATDWPEDVLSYTRSIAMRVNPDCVKLSWRRLRGPLLITLHTSRMTGREGTVGASDDWGRVLAFLGALIRLGAKPEDVITALKTVPR